MSGRKRCTVAILAFIAALTTSRAAATDPGIDDVADACAASERHGLLTNIPVARFRTIFRELLGGKNVSGAPIGSFGANRVRIDNLTAKNFFTGLDGPWKHLRARLREGEYVEPNYVVRIQSSDTGTDTRVDTHLNLQWGLDKIGAKDAWRQSKGSRNVTVAILDTGIDFKHPDLAPNVWRSREPFSVDIQDSLETRTIECSRGVPGFNALGADPACKDPLDVNDDHSHGTHVAGIIGAVGGNGLGVAGVNWNVTLLVVKVLNSSGVGTIESVARGMDFLLDVHSDRRLKTKIRIVNASFGYACAGKTAEQVRSATLDGYLRRLSRAGMLVVAAADNASRNLDDKRANAYYLTGFEYPAILSVTGFNEEGRQTRSWGKTSLDLAAPSEVIYSTTKGSIAGGTEEEWAVKEQKSGTSMATAFVSGAAALVLSRCPRLTATDLKTVLLRSAEALPCDQQGRVQYGRVNVNRALRMCRRFQRRPGPRG